MKQEILWMCAFNSYAPGKHCGKSEFECTGMEILDEILLSLPMDDATLQKCRDEVVAAIPCAMPYIDAQFLPRAVGDRPDVVPAACEEVQEERNTPDTAPGGKNGRNSSNMFYLKKRETS